MGHHLPFTIYEGDAMNYHQLPHDKIPDILKLNKRPLKVYIALCRYATFGTGLCYPGYKRLKQDTGISNGRDVRKAIQDLEDAGLITTWLQGNKRHYQVL